jgi:hypothetical protein
VSRTEQRPVIRHHAFFREGAGATRVPLTRGAHIRVCAEHARTAVWCSNTHGLRRTAVVTRAATAAKVPTQTPHSGYHWDKANRERFFEGWYFRITIPQGPSFAWMYSIEVSHSSFVPTIDMHRLSPHSSQRASLSSLGFRRRDVLGFGHTGPGGWRHVLRGGRTGDGPKRRVPDPALAVGAHVLGVRHRARAG